MLTIYLLNMTWHIILCDKFVKIQISWGNAELITGDGSDVAKLNVAVDSFLKWVYNSVIIKGQNLIDTSSNMDGGHS